MSMMARFKIVILGWAAASVFFTAVLEVGDLGHKPLGFALYSNAVQFALWAVALPLLAKLIRRFPLKDPKRIQNAGVLLALIAVLGTLVALTHLAIISPYFPDRSSYPTFGDLIRSELVRFLPNDVLIGIVLVIAIEGWHVLQDLQSERMRAMDLERQLAVSRLEALRTQLQPHFLFNTLHTIAGLIAEQPPTARRMVVALGDLLRLTLKDRNSSVRSLAEELEFADLYLGIEKLRLGDRLVLDYDIEPEATSAEVPLLLLQPLFENAVRHGAARTLQPCEICFRAYRRDAALHLVVHNDGPVRSRSAGSPSFGLGLTNTMARLRLHYDNDFTFKYTDRPQGGAVVEMTIPYRRASNGAADHRKEGYAGAPAAYACPDH
jgi:two-component system, LytTR family, sensor kinase